MRNMLRLIKKWWSQLYHHKILVTWSVGIAGRKDIWLEIILTRGGVLRTISIFEFRKVSQHQKVIKKLSIVDPPLQPWQSWMLQHLKVLLIIIQIKILEYYWMQGLLKATPNRNMYILPAEAVDILELTPYIWSQESIKTSRKFGNPMSGSKFLSHQFLLKIWLKDLRFTRTKLRRHYFQIKIIKMKLLKPCLFPGAHLYKGRFLLENPHQRIGILQLWRSKKWDYLLEETHYINEWTTQGHIGSISIRVMLGKKSHLKMSFDISQRTLTQLIRLSGMRIFTPLQLRFPFG